MKQVVYDESGAVSSYKAAFGGVVPLSSISRSRVRREWWDRPIVVFGSALVSLGLVLGVIYGAVELAHAVVLAVIA